MGFYFKKNGIPFQKKWDSISKKMGFHLKKNGILYHKNFNINFQEKIMNIKIIIEN